jgi:pyruvate formate-lyase activating enzyme-like uncharacterized protein
VIATPYKSFRKGPLPRGCRLCVQGKKLVLFVTGRCSRGCFYCPISEQKKGKDVVFANEWPTRKIKEIIEEGRLCGAQGAGFTGGDPLVVMSRTIRYIRALKKEFGEGFHIHLYTPLSLATESKLKSLYNAGLDEIRFHPDLFSRKLWERIKLAGDFEWDVGIEIPVIPGQKKETKALITYSIPYISFINLNELEYSDTSAQDLGKRKLRTKDEMSYGIKGSEEMALSLLEWIERKKYPLKVHYCTAGLKDGVFE